MGAQLNIKNGEAYQLAQEIAGTTGESITEAVTEALRARLREVRHSKALEPSAQRAREEAFYAIVDGSRARWPDFTPSIDHGDLLYDEYGLPPVIIDTSVMISYLREEPETPRFLAVMMGEGGRLKMSVANYLEAAIVIDAKTDEVLSERLQRLIDFFDIELVPVDRHQADVARHAYRLYGKGHHPARLNFGDCFAYALARVTAEPLLFKGDDFTKTDITPASLP